MKRICVLLIAIILHSVVYGQIKKKEIDAIRNDTTLFWGMSPVCGSQDEAAKKAKNELYTNIANNCKANGIYLEGNAEKDLLNIVKTYDDLMKKCLIEKNVIEDAKNGEYQCITWMRRSDFRRMCNDRKREIANHISDGVKYEESVSFEDALKHYYYSLILIYSHPQGKNLRFDVRDEYGSIIYKNIDYSWIKDRIDDGENGVLKNINFIVPKEDAITKNNDGTMMMKLIVKNSKGKDVSYLNCESYNGQGWDSNIVRDGELNVLIFDKDITSIMIRIDFKTFEKEARMFSEHLSNSLNYIRIHSFKNNYYTVDLKRAGVGEEKDDDALSICWEDIIKNHVVVNEKIYEKRMNIIYKALRDGRIEDARECFSENGYNRFDTLSRYGKMTVVSKPEYTFISCNNEVVCRSITIRFDIRNTPFFSQDVVFRFDTINKVVTSLAFRLSDHAERDIVSKKWPDKSKLLLINFLEDYQTAYALKDIKYLESIYSDDAIIIVGHVLKRAPDLPDRIVWNLTENDVKLINENKATYMKNLNNCFKLNNYIRLRFTETDFNVTSESDVYGVRVKQEYYSSTYIDVGFLFLIVDLSKILPIIHVRAWQPAKADIDDLMNYYNNLRFH